MQRSQINQIKEVLCDVTASGSPGSRGTCCHTSVSACGPFGAVNLWPSHSPAWCWIYSTAHSPQAAHEELLALLDGAMPWIPKSPALGQPSSVFQRFLCTRSLPQEGKEHPASLWEEHREACSCRTLPGPERTQKHREDKWDLCWLLLTKWAQVEGSMLLNEQVAG